MNEKKTYKCPFCGEEREYEVPKVICPCEVTNTGMDEFWQN